MSGLFVPLDVEYDSDDKIIVAGVYAETLYVRSLAFSKRTMNDGNISRAQLVVISRGIPSPLKQVARLVEVGLWIETPKGWHVAAWLKRNKSTEDIKTDKASKKAASEKGNHERWHVGEGKKPSDTCPYCHPKDDPKPDPKPDRKGKPEPEGEPEPEPQGEPEPEPAAAAEVSDGSTSEYGSPAAAAAIEMYIEHRVQQTHPENPGGFRITLRKAVPRENGPAIAAYIAKNPDADAADVLTHAFGLDEIAVYRLTGQARKGA